MWRPSLREHARSLHERISFFLTRALTSLFLDTHTEVQKKSVVTKGKFWFREIGGLVRGAIQEHARSVAGPDSWLLLPTRRFTMHSEFRFPKATPLLMTLI